MAVLTKNSVTIFAVTVTITASTAMAINMCETSTIVSAKTGAYSKVFCPQPAPLHNAPNNVYTARALLSVILRIPKPTKKAILIGSVMNTGIG